MYDNMIKRNHFVSRGYLKFFCNEKEEILVYDKDSDKAFNTTVNNICVKKNIYNGIEENQEISWEDFYTEIDRNIPKIINKTKRYCEISVIDKPFQVENIKEDIALIMVIQMLRTPERVFSQTKLYNDILEDFKNALSNDEVIDKEEKLAEEIVKKYDAKTGKDLNQIMRDFMGPIIRKFTQDLKKI